MSDISTDIDRSERHASIAAAAVVASRPRSAVPEVVVRLALQMFAIYSRSFVIVKPIRDAMRVQPCARFFHRIAILNAVDCYAH